MSTTTMSTWGDACKLQAQSNAGRDLLVWAVQQNPGDFPGKFTARPTTMFSKEPVDFVLVSESLDGIRKMLPPGLVRLDREPDDSPSIVEAWV